jgi:D-alanyl-D-alanine carboxypeptidase
LIRYFVTLTFSILFFQTAAFSHPASLLVAEEGGRVFVSENTAIVRPMASLTKIGSALFAVSLSPLDRWIRVSETVRSRGPDDRSAPLRLQEQYTLRDMVAAMLISSTNAASRSVAKELAGSESEFVRRLGEFGARRGWKQTRFADSHGLSPASISSVDDISRMMDDFIRNPDLMKALESVNPVIHEKQGRTIGLLSTLDLREYRGFRISGKTGRTTAAGQCFAGFAVLGSKRYRIIFLGSSDMQADIRAAVDQIKK